MGNFVIEVRASGNDGCQRDVKDGEIAAAFCGVDRCPDCLARAFAADLVLRGCSIESATLTHQPLDQAPVVENLVTLQRTGTFAVGPMMDWDRDPKPQREA